MRRHVVVGTGGIAHAHAEAVAAQGGRARVVGAVDLDAARAQEFAAKHGVAHWSTDLAEALETARADGGVDLVHVCTPPGSHVPLARQCLETGVPVLLEKPPALSLAETDELLELSHRTGVDVAVVFQHRFGPGAIRARQLLGDDDALGRALVAVCHTLWFRDDDYFALPWRGRWDVEGGGPTMGHGIHQIDLLLSLLPEWEEVTAMAARLARPTDTEDVSAAVVRFDGGTIGTVVNSLLSPRQVSTVRVDAEGGTIEVDHLYGYTDADWRLTPVDGRALTWPEDDGGPASGHAHQVGAILDAMDAGEPLPVSLVDARATLELLAAIYASAFTGQVVRRGEITAGHPFYTRMDGTGAPWPSHREDS